MAINTGVNISKFVGYAVLAPKLGVNITKLNAYVVLSSVNVTPPSWPTFSFGPGSVGIAYSQAWDMPLAAPTVTYSVLSGSLPPGLALSAITANQANISGTPTTVGTYSFTLRATNAYGTADQAFSITITNNALVVPVGSILQSALKGSSYSETITEQGGTAAYTFAISSGALPTGLSINASTGVISGTPSAVGTFTFTVQITDSLGNVGSQSFQIIVSSPTIVSYGPALGDGIVGTPYSETLQAGGGTAPYTYAVTSGALPTGLSLASGGGITGTPTVAGVYSFTVTATDANSQTSAESFQIIVVAAAASGSGGSWVF